MATIKIHGMPPSTFTRTVLLAAEEKGIDYELVMTRPMDMGALNPFLKISFDETWELAFSSGTPTWTFLVPSAPLPDARAFMAFALDDPARTLWVYGGRTTSGYANDVWGLSLDATATWARFIAWLFFAIILINCVAAVILWLLRGAVQAAEERCVR